MLQRPQHLLSRAARDGRVFFFEEPLYDAAIEPRLEVTRDATGVFVAVPHLRGDQRDDRGPLRRMVDGLCRDHALKPDVLWYYTPMALHFSDHLTAPAIVYDCMDELSAFQGAPPGLRDAERALLARAGVVFTGGRSLFESKRHLHPNIHPFPSSVDVAHFARARRWVGPEPADQAPIPHPRLGFYGVLDERLDRDLIAGVAALRPAWHLVLVGPVAKIDPATLPQSPGIHYLGGKSYAQLPEYLAGWDVALLPFARNASTKYISPTKTPEYLAAGRPVVSTSIADVVHPYGDRGLARIADTPDEVVAAVEAALGEDPEARRSAASALLSTMSWDRTWASMSALIDPLCGKDSGSCSITSSLGPALPDPSWPS